MKNTVGHLVLAVAVLLIASELAALVAGSVEHMKQLLL